MELALKYKKPIQNEFSDVEIILYNDQRVVKMNLHRIILSVAEFFYTMFQFNRDKKTYELFAENIDVMEHVIMSMYGIKTELDYPMWQSVLEIFVCRNYLR